VKLHATDEGFPWWHFKDTIKQMDSLVDLYHVHNEPDCFVEPLKSVTKKPVIWDVHDLESQRSGKIGEWEKSSMEKCDGICTVSPTYEKILAERSGKPTMSYMSYVIQELFPQERTKVQHRGIVYEGGVGVTHHRGIAQEFACRDWGDVFRKLTNEVGVPVWVYRANMAADVSALQGTGVMLMGPVPYDQLLGNMTAYEAGLVGSPFPDPMFDGALPNKLFEYISAGIPILAYNAGDDVNQFILATKFGAVLDNLNEIPDVLEEFRKDKYRERMWRDRFNWTMERQIPSIEEFYQMFLSEKA